MGSSIVHTIDGDYIREWMMLGPFFPDDLDRDFLADVGGEANIRPYEGMSVTAPDGRSCTWKRHKAEFDFINLQDAVKQLLFSVDLKFQSELDGGSKQPSGDLRQAFGDSGFPLSEKATIAMDNKGSSWWVIDKGNQQDYVVQKQEEKLNVYSEPRGAVAYAACNLLSPKAQRLEMVLERFDSVKVWVNGSLIHSTSERNRWDTERFGIPLKAGENLCLIKVAQYVGGTELKWGFNAKVLDYENYLNSLRLALTVRRHHPDGQDELNISARREPQSTVWELSSLPVQIEIRDEASQLLKTLQSSEGRPVVWTVPEEVEGTIRILAKQTDALGKTLEAWFTCRAHSIIPVTPQVGYWETYKVSDGLGGSKVYSMVQDRDGFLWFGLQGTGICRYDGRTFYTFTDEDGLPSKDVWTLFEDSKGNLWIGTMSLFTLKGAGVCRYDGETFQSFTTKDGLASNAVTAICEDDRGHLWFGTPDSGVSEFDGRIFRNYTTEDGLSSNKVGAIALDGAGSLWFGHAVIGAGSGLTRYDGNSFNTFTAEDGPVNNEIRCITTDAQGNLWFGTNGGVSKYDGKSFKSLTRAEGLVNNSIFGVLQAKNGDMWFGTWSGVSRYSEGIFQNFTSREGLAHDFVWCIAEDREGNLWFGTHTSGASRYDESIESIPVGNRSISAIDSSGSLWYYTGELCRYDGGKVRTFAIEDGLLRLGEIRGFYEDSLGNIWIGTWGGGLARYDGKEFRMFTARDGLTNNYVYSITESRTGLLWIGTSGSICTYDGERFVQVAGKKELGETWDWIPCITEDSKGNIWFAIPRYGIGKYDGEECVMFSPEDGLSGHVIFQLTEDREGNMWFATQDGGACRYDGESFRAFTTEDGLAENDVHGIHEDSRGNLWFRVATGGVHKFDGRNFQVFTTDDGLLSNFAWNVVEDKAGNIVFFTSKGITIYTPPAEEIPPPIFVTEVVADRVYPMPVETRHPVSLQIPSTTPRISFSYYGASFKTKRMRYNYMLEGHDSDWRATWNEQVSYENLKPGKYTFRVIAITRDLVYSEPASVELEVIPDPRNHRIAQLEGELAERERAEMERIYGELEDARQIQQSLLPKEIPQIEGFEIAGTSLPAREVSGDFYDYLSLGDNVGIVLADVTGKSVKAAMVAALADGMLDAEIKGQRELWDSPSKILSALNMGLKPRLIRGMFTAMSLGIICAGEKRLLFSNAGMPYPIVKRGKEAWELEVDGMPLGLVDRMEYQDLSFDMEGRDFVVFYSDGVIEAENESEEMYGTERLVSVMAGMDPSASAEDAIEAIFRDVAQFVGDAEQYDDMTVVAVKKGS